MAKKEKHIIGITIGDINGIGPEIIIKSLADGRLLNYLTPVIYGSSRTLSYYRKLLKYDDFQVFHLKEGQTPNPKMVNVVDCWEDTAEIRLGEPQKQAGERALKALNKACDHLQEGFIDALVTAPVNKAMMQSEEFTFPGHTEYLGKRFEGEPLMFMIAETLRVAVATGHIPLSKVPQALDQEGLIKTIKAMKKSLVRDFGIGKPRIAVLGLNPHAGEVGLLGKEEQEVIEPVIRHFKEKNDLVFGPFPADGFFGSGQFAHYDAVLAMYHDQGLIPFKSMAFGRGVNFTANLPVVRTSPDHGTGYDIAGKGKASYSSMQQAIWLAHDILKTRKETTG